MKNQIKPVADTRVNEDGSILQVRSLEKSFGTLEVLTDISFSVLPGQVLAIIGPSGSGSRPCCAASISWKKPIMAQSTFAE